MSGGVQGYGASLKEVPTIGCDRCGGPIRERDLCVFVRRDDDSGLMAFRHDRCMGRKGWQLWLEREFPRWRIEYHTSRPTGPDVIATTLHERNHGFRATFLPSLSDPDADPIAVEQAPDHLAPNAVVDLTQLMQRLQEDWDQEHGT